jgi:hypothetical protein
MPHETKSIPPSSRGQRFPWTLGPVGGRLLSAANAKLGRAQLCARQDNMRRVPGLLPARRPQKPTAAAQKRWAPGDPTQATSGSYSACRRPNAAAIPPPRHLPVAIRAPTREVLCDSRSPASEHGPSVRSVVRTRAEEHPESLDAPSLRTIPAADGVPVRPIATGKSPS